VAYYIESAIVAEKMAIPKFEVKKNHSREREG
jgi:hypothetical protein